MINIFACTCPNCSGDGAIDKPERFEQAFDTYYIPEASEKIFMDDISMVRPQKIIYAKRSPPGGSISHVKSFTALLQ